MYTKGSRKKRSADNSYKLSGVSGVIGRYCVIESYE